MIRAQRQRIVPLIFLNLVLVVILLFILDHFGVFSWRKLLSSSKPQTTTENRIVEDPFLLEKEELRKQWLVLTEKERLYEEKVGEIKQRDQILEEKLKEADNQIKIAKDMQQKQQDLKKQYEDRAANVRDLASKIGNMPPKDGVALLERMDSPLAVDVIRQMDKIALENDKKSITDYLLSIMDKEKASILVRLLSKYPQDPTPPPSPQEAPQDSE